MASSIGLGRPADSKNRIVEEFRSRIVLGELHPGSRFPTRREIEQQYGAGATTVQRALESLRDAGFISVNGRQGTFVADNPPHLSRYAVVFSHEASEPNLGQFWRALASELEFVSAQRPECQLLGYYGVDGHEDSEDFARLCREVMTNRIAGLIFTSHPYQLLNTPILDQPDIPRVAIMAPYDFPFPIVLPEGNSFLIRAVDYLYEQGHRRIAFLYSASGLASVAFIKSLVAQRQLESYDYWYQGVDTAVPEIARNCVNLLMHCSEVPDALVICDDNLVEFATTGLMDAEGCLPKDFTVIAHANFPYPTPCRFPAKRLGFDIRQLLQQCVDKLDAQRRGEPVSPITNLTACFEEDLRLPIRL